MTTSGDDPVTAVSRRGGGVAAWRQIADRMEGEIAAGEPVAGAQLPTEAALAARFRVNRHTVRQALGALAERGLVRSSQGRGTFVEPRPLAYPIGPRTRFSEIVARGGREPGGALVAAATEAADAATAAALSVAASAPTLRIDTLRSADGVPLSFARSWLPLPRFAGLDDALRDGETVSAALAALGAGDYRRAHTRIAARHALADETLRLELAPGRIVLVVESVNVDRDGEPIQRTVSAFAADRVEIEVET